jgi:hypothetical protein
VRYASGLRLILVSAVVAGAWVGVHLLFTFVYPDDTAAGTAYRYRDDALVTLSHARGLADVGTVSVSVSGSRVEGYSAPLQFAAASGYYGVGGDGYRGFLDGQVVVTTMLLGVSVYALLRMAVPRRRPAATALVTLLVAAALFGTYAFFGWHSSGMENSITNALAAAGVAALAFVTRRPSLLPAAGIVVALFAVSRVEFAFHAVPLLVVAATFLAVGAPAGERWRRVALLVAPAVTLWLAVLAVRLWYFRDLFPNTAEAQGISPAHNVRLWAEVLWPLLLPAAYAAFHVLRRRSTGLSGLVRNSAFGVAAAAGAAGAAVLAWRAYADDNLPGVDALVDSSRVLGLWWWVALVLGLALLVRPRLGPVEALLVTLVASGACHVLVFGPARLAVERVVTFALVPLVCLAAAFALRFQPPRVLVSSTATARGAARGAAAAVLILGAIVGGLVSHRTWASRQVLCCDVSAETELVLAQVASVERRSRLPVVSVANPDLGLISIQKRVNVTDLGELGDPLLARVWRRARESGRTDVAVDYLNHYAAPDVVELHGVWSCAYGPWWRSAEFRARYQKVRDDGWTETWGRQYCPQAGPLEGGIWVRAGLDDAANPEVALSRALAADPDPAIVRREVARCRSSEASSCQHVTRSVLRNLRAFDDAGTLGDAVAAFHGLPSVAYDEGVLSSRDRGDWYRSAADALFRRAGG